MGRQTAFPGIWVDGLSVSGQAPQDIPGSAENFVERGVSREFEALQRAAEFGDDTVGEFIESAEDMVGPFMDEFYLTYELKVKALPSDMNAIEKLQERSVSTRARAFARTKNPTELEVFDVSRPTKDEKLSGQGLKVYDVEVTVTK